MTPDEVREIARDEVEAYMRRVSEVALLDLSVNDQLSSMPLLKMLVGEMAPLIGRASLDGK